MIMRWMSLAFVAALALRLTVLAVFQDSLFARHLLVDAAWHDAWAWDWARGRWSQTEAFYRAPLYPYLLSWIYEIFGHSTHAVRVIQAVAGASAVAALTGAAGSLAGGRAAWAAAILGSTYGTWIHFDGELLIPALLLPLLSWALFALVRARGPRGFLVGAALLGLAATARPNVLVLALPLLVFLWQRRVGRSGLAGALIMFLAPAVFVTFLNYRAEQAPVLVSSQGGFNFYAGNHALATGRSAAIPELWGTSSWREFLEEAREVAERDRGRALNSAEQSNYWAGRAWSYMREHPGDWLGLTAKKAYYAINGYEIPNNRSLYLHQPAPLRPFLWSTAWFSFPWGAVFPLAVAGLIGFWKVNRTTARFLAGWLALYALSVVAFFVCARFRMGLVPVMILAAALPFGVGLSRLPRSAWIAGCVALVLCNTGFWNVRERNEGQELTKLATLQLESGRVELGLATLETAMSRDSTDITTRYLLADTYYDLGRYAEAIPLFEDVVHRRPSDHRAVFALGTAYLAVGRNAAAVERLERATHLKSKDASTWINLGAAYAARDLREQAADAYRRGIDLAPAADKATLGLAEILIKEQDLRGAVAVLASGTQRGADSPEVWHLLARAHFVLEEWEACRGALMELLQRSPGDPRARELLNRLPDSRTGPDSTGNGGAGR